MNNSTTGMHDIYQDTIVALATPMGKGALAIIRISGKDTFKSVSSYFRLAADNESLSPAELKKKKRFVGVIAEEKRIIDEVVISCFIAPNSYTGEDLIEITCHCNPFIIREIIELILKTARTAKPGEFTQRAFFNNRMDLTRAEAVGDLLNARTELSHRAAVSQLEGSLYNKISKMLEEITSRRIDLELEIDFVEQDLPEISTEKLKTDLLVLSQELNLLLETGKKGLIIREGLSVSLVGAPNVGKSSLFNHLLSSDRAIVTNIPGTTRDYLEESISLDGYLVKLYDTAGLRMTSEKVESIGISRTEKIIEVADRIIYIEDGEQGEGECEQYGLKKEDPRIIGVLNKSDILGKEKIDGYKERGFIICSAKTGEGIDLLKEEIVRNLAINSEVIESGILSNMRQIEAVDRCVRSIDHAIRSLGQKLGFEFTAFDLKEASEALEEITGKITTDEILNRIFDNFCIGK